MAGTVSKPLKEKSKFKRNVFKYRYFYLMFTPVLAALALFYYWPMLGIRYSFYKYTPMMDTPVFVGLTQFRKLFSTPRFWLAFRNTLEISITSLILGIVVAVILSLLMNEMKKLRLKKFAQTVVYLPHFLSWVVVASIFMLILSPQGGFVNDILVKLGFISHEKPIFFLANEHTWRPTYYIIHLWREAGYSTVIFIATLAGISPELYEAASIDGAGKLKQAMYITIPLILNTVVIVFILNLAKVLNLFESVFVMYNPSVYNVADVLQTYVFRSAMVEAVKDYGYSTAVGLFRSVISLILVLICNFISKKVRGRGIL